MKIKGKVIILFIINTLLMITLIGSVLGVNSVYNSTSCSGGEWNNCNNAFADGGGNATGDDNDQTVWKNYLAVIPQNSIITQIILRVDASFDGSGNQTAFVDVSVSDNNGSSFGSDHTLIGNSTNFPLSGKEQTFLINVTNDRSWTTKKLINFSVQADCQKNVGSPTCRIDWLPVNITYTPFDFSLSANPSNGSAPQKRNISTLINSTLLGGLSQKVNLSVSGCPANANCLLNTSTINSSGAANLTIELLALTLTGTYPINITGNSSGVIRSTIFTLNVTDSQPSAQIAADPESGIVPLTVVFNGSVSDGDGPFSFFWDFGGDGTSDEQNPVHNFTSPGSYPVSLTVTDYDGDNDTAFKTINVENFVISANPSSDLVVQARNQSTIMDIINAGFSGPVNLSVINCPPSSSCNIDPNNGSPTFSSNLTVSTSPSTPVGSYDINITASNGGKERSTIYTLTVTDLQPAAEVKANTTSGIASFFDVFFELNVSSPGDGPYDFLWDFNDSTTSASQNVSHTFIPGVYNVSGTVTDYDGDSSTGYITINVTAPSCGDTIVNQQNESCDDGNTDNTDSCTNACQSPVCGDTYVQPSNNETCDDGNTDNNDSCLNSCQTAVCGDGYAQTGVEACDDGNTNNTDSCTNSCNLPVCGDSYVQPSNNEACDDGNNDDNDGCDSQCVEEYCGDGSQQSSEACDDGNNDDNDGCDSQCVEEYCGDGSINNGGTEQCDDGIFNEDSCTPDYGDSCSVCTTNCEIYEATGPYCGDGNIDEGEICDDGAENGQVCIPDYGSSCSYCSENCFGNDINGPYCGDGIVNGPEECDGDAGLDQGQYCTRNCEIQEPFCGDGVLDEENEACDDGNNENGDGCDEFCELEEEVPIPEFSSIAGGLAVVGAGIGYIFLRRRK